jgi:hypothetical protein
MIPKGEWMTLREVAEDLGLARISRADLDQLGIPYVARGRVPRIPKCRYQKWMETGA